MDLASPATSSNNDPEAETLKVDPTKTKTKNVDSISGYTRYAPDSRYPAASIAFDLTDPKEQQPVKFESYEDGAESDSNLKVEPGVNVENTSLSCHKGQMS
jgi:hypothetical protein